MVKQRIGAGLVALTLIVATSVIPRAAETASGKEIDRNVDAALANLYARRPEAKALAQRARGVLVFPSILKAGFLFGAQYGDGALRRKGKTVGYYNTVAASYGLQAGLQEFGYALFFMSDSALEYLSRTEGFEIGVGPSVVIVDEGVARTLTSTTAKDDIYAFIFDQRGLMAGLGLQGSKITRIDR
jgi:lipid-binding SYLF domain-containing protein